MPARSKKSSKAPPRVDKVDTLGGVLKELGRVYRQARQSDLPWSDATKAAYVLHNIRAVIETAIMERRVSELEQRLGIRDGSTKTD